MSAKPLTNTAGTAPGNIAPPGNTTDCLPEIRQLVAGEFSPLPEILPSSSILGDFQALWMWLAASRHKPAPKISRPRIALFMAAHGAFPEQQAGLAGILSALKNGSHPVSPLLGEADADLQVYELDLSVASGDFRKEPALDEKQAAQALAYGMMAVQPGIDLLLLAALNPVAAAAGMEIDAALKGGMDPLDALLRFGGFDIAAMTGALIAARLARLPVLVEGAAALSAAAMLEKLKPGAADHAKSANELLKEKSALPPPGAGALLIPLLKALSAVA